MTLFAYLNGSDIGYRVRLNGFGLSTRADGSPGFGGIVFDDSTGDLDVRGWMSVIVRETACTSAPVLFRGYIADRTYSRNGQAPYSTGASRWIDSNIVDANAVLHIRLITGSDGKRPAETHNDRITWLAASSYLSGLITDTSLVNTGNPRPFQAADYRGQYPDDVLNDLAAPIFRIFFVYPDPVTGARGLFFDSPSVTTTNSTLTISNVLSDQSATCYPPSLDATLTRDPSEVYARVRYTYANGTVIRNNATTDATYFTDNGLGYRGLQVDNTRIGVQSSAVEMADSILSRDGSENDTISVTVQLPAAQAGLIRAGQRIGVRFSHLPGFSTLTYTRVTGLTINQSAGTDQLYDLKLELNAHGLSGGGGGGAPAPSVLPLPSGSCTAGDSTADDLAHSLGTASVSNPYGVSISYSNVPANLIDHNYASFVGAGSSGAPGVGVAFYVQWNIDLGTAKKVATAIVAVDPADTATGGGAGSEPAQGIEVWASDDGSTYHRATLASAWTGPDTTTAPGSNIYTVSIPSVDRSHRYWAMRCLDTFYGGFWGGFTVQDFRLIECLGGVLTAPSPGQLVGPETVTMSGANGTTAWPFADGSLRVYHDGFDQTINVSSYDGAAGTFTLNYTPDTGSTIVVTYLGR